MSQYTWCNQAYCHSSVNCSSSLFSILSIISPLLIIIVLLGQ